MSAGEQAIEQRAGEQPADVRRSVANGGATAWARNLAAPVRDFLSTETGGAIAMLAGTVIALVWANSPWSHTYDSVWSTQLAIRIGSAGISADLRHWVNEGLMTLFFLVVGLEAKRELDLGELRERRRLAIPVFAAIGGILVPVAIYLAFNAGGPGAHGWGAAMSTDTAFALAVAGAADAALGDADARVPADARRRRRPRGAARDRDRLHEARLGARAGGRDRAVRRAAGAALRAVRARGRCRSAVAVGIWVAMFKSGIDPVISGLAIGLATSAYPPSRARTSSGRPRSRARSASSRRRSSRAAPQQGLLSAISPNERLQYDAAPVDELRDRAAVRARQRRHPRDRRAARRRRRLADHARDPDRLRRRQADRDRGRLVARLAAGAARPALAGERARCCSRAGPAPGSASRSRC